MDSREMHLKIDAAAKVIHEGIRQRWVDEEKHKQRLANELQKLIKERIAA